MVLFAGENHAQHKLGERGGGDGGEPAEMGEGGCIVVSSGGGGGIVENVERAGAGARRESGWESQQPLQSLLRQHPFVHELSAATGLVFVQQFRHVVSGHTPQFLLDKFALALSARAF